MEVLRIPPPVIVSPLEETSPPPATESPEAEKEDVAEEELVIEPPVKVSPLEAARLAAEIPPVKVEVAAAVD